MFENLINGTTQEYKQEEMELFTELAIDFETGEPLVEKNDFIVLEGNEALKVWIFKSLKTELNKYEIYSESYGNELNTYIGTVYNKATKEVLLIEELKNSLLVNPYILVISDFVFDYNNETNSLTINFSLETIYGKIEQEGVVIQ